MHVHTLRKKRYTTSLKLIIKSGVFPTVNVLSCFCHIGLECCIPQLDDARVPPGRVHYTGVTTQASHRPTTVTVHTCLCHLYHVRTIYIQPSAE